MTTSEEPERSIDPFFDAVYPAELRAAEFAAADWDTEANHRRMEAAVLVRFGMARYRRPVLLYVSACVRLAWDAFGPSGRRAVVLGEAQTDRGAMVSPETVDWVRSAAEDEPGEIAARDGLDRDKDAAIYNRLLLPLVCCDHVGENLNQVPIGTETFRYAPQG